jgi:hypothetical protein
MLNFSFWDADTGERKRTIKDEDNDEDTFIVASGFVSIFIA